MKNTKATTPNRRFVLDGSPNPIYTINGEPVHAPDNRQSKSSNNETKNSENVNKKPK